MIQIAYVLCWWLILVILGLVSFPLVSRVCCKLGDRGYSISKLVGLVFITFFVWMLASLKLLPFGFPSIAVSFLLLAALSLYLGRKNLRISEWPRRQIIITEAVFAIAFVVFLLIRFGAPDIYFSGVTDSFFNLAFIEQIAQGGYFPPQDPWLAGETIPYYYGGHVMVALLSWITNVPTSIAFNIAGAMFAALAVCASYGLGYNITKRKLYGCIAAFFVCVVGYTAGAFQLAAHLSHSEVLGYAPSNAPNIIEWFLNFDFWTGPWLVEGTIVHYPYYSFLYGDLHSYWVSIPFQLMFIALIYAIFQRSRSGERSTVPDNLLDILIPGLCLGFFAILNTWELPTYAIFTFLAFILLRIRSSISGSLFVALAIIGFSGIFYIPYYVSGGMSGFNGLGLVGARTTLPQFLEFCGLFAFAVCSMLLIMSKRDLIPGFRGILKSTNSFPKRDKLRIIVTVLIAVILVSTVISMVLHHFQLLIVVVPVILLCLLGILKSELSTAVKFVLLLIIMSMALAFFSDFLYIDDALSGDNERFNTVLKIYLQLWVFFGISAAFAVYYVSARLGKKTKVVWVVLLAVPVILSIIHPLAATTSMLSGRHDHWGLKRGTLDGIAYIETVDKGDYHAVKWINEEIEGTPVVLEAPGGPGSYSSRVSAFTGMRTVIGWVMWEKMWRPDWGEIDQRNNDVDTMYNTLDNNEVLELLKKYDVSYVYIGSLERGLYEGGGLQKFAAQPEYYAPIYDREGVTIFQVRGD